VLGGDVADELLDEHRLADAGAAEQADLAALGVRSQEVDDLDAGLEDGLLGRLLVEGGRLPVNRQRLVRVGDRTLAVDRLAEEVEEAAERLLADRNGDRPARVGGFHPALEAVRRGHGHATDDVVADVGGHLDRQQTIAVLDGDGVQDVRKRIRLELDVHRRADDLEDLADVLAARAHEVSHCYFSASAPPTISASSLVMAAWRARLRCRISAEIRSVALREAEPMATMRAPCSEAADSRKAARRRVAT
jgi:hypothetical protein